MTPENMRQLTYLLLDLQADLETEHHNKVHPQYLNYKNIELLGATVTLIDYLAETVHQLEQDGVLEPDPVDAPVMDAYLKAMLCGRFDLSYPEMQAIFKQLEIDPELDEIPEEVAQKLLKRIEQAFLERANASGSDNRKQ